MFLSALSLLPTFLLAAFAMPATAAAAGEGSAGNAADELHETRIQEPVFAGETVVYEAGRGRARTLVLVHGLGGQGGLDYREVLVPLGRYYHVVAFDLPGFGRASKGNLAYTPSAYVSFIKHVGDKFARRPFILLGHSLGGALALRYAATYPADVERLAVVSAAGILHRASYSEFLSKLGIDLLPVFYSRQKDDMRGLASMLLGRMERLNLEPEIILSSATLRQAILKSDPSKIAGLALVLDDFSKVLPQVKSPTLIIWGANDSIAPLRTGQLLASVLPRAKLVVLADAEHVPMREQPAAFRAALMPFLAASDPAAAVATEVPTHLASPRTADAVRTGECKGNSQRSFSGDYERVVVRECTGVRIRDARIRELRVYDSTVEILNSEIGGDAGGMTLLDARVSMTGGRVAAPVAITARNSDMDFAGVYIRGTEAAIKAPLESRAVFSVSRIDSPHTRGGVHDFYRLTADKPL